MEGDELRLIWTGSFALAWLEAGARWTLGAGFASYKHLWKTWDCKTIHRREARGVFKDWKANVIAVIVGISTGGVCCLEASVGDTGDYKTAYRWQRGDLVEAMRRLLSLSSLGLRLV